MQYQVAQPTREWEWSDGSQTHLVALDGRHEITQDDVYGYWTLSSPEVPCIAQHMVMHTLVMLADEA